MCFPCLQELMHTPGQYTTFHSTALATSLTSSSPFPFHGVADVLPAARGANCASLLSKAHRASAKILPRLLTVEVS